MLIAALIALIYVLFACLGAMGAVLFFWVVRL